MTQCLIIRRYLRYGETCIQGFEICLFKIAVNHQIIPLQRRQVACALEITYNEDTTEREGVEMNTRTT